MPFTEGASNRIEKRADGLWHCIHCDFSNVRYQPVIGHLGKHTPDKARVKGPGRPRKQRDPLSMSISEIIDQLDELTTANNALRSELAKERDRNIKIREALAAFMQPTS